MKLKVKHQERYSRLELLLRTFLGLFYIILPHSFLFIFVVAWGVILRFLVFWIILFTGKYPIKMFQFQVGLLRWILRVLARFYNVSDGYPAFGINGADEHTLFEVVYPEKINRGMVLLRLFFGPVYVYLPHGFILLLRTIFVWILIFFAWWVVLFTGKYPLSIHKWVVGQVRWGYRISLYMGYMTDKYPAFTGDELPEEV
ncbi:MAG: DUF4389 domain-containing protein [Bacteroidales bacterium]|nr:DUF4389 domain-containing protein [Bacteroidales bacterium]MDD3891431.1 DUF4389 domain-containing protein [Bacteroidales bacterium]